MRVTGYTVVPTSWLPSARVVAASFLRHHPTATFYTYVLDHFSRLKLIETDWCDGSLRWAGDVPNLEVPLNELAVALGREHVISYLRPRIASELAHECDVVLCLSHQNFFSGSISEHLLRATESDLMVVPRRLTKTPNDGLEPSSHQSIDSGAFNTGVLAARSSANEFFDWWESSTKLELTITNNPDFRFVDVAASIFPTAVISDPRVGVCYWNLDERREVIKHRHVLHHVFEGFDPRKPYWPSLQVSESANLRTSLSENNSIGDLYENYSASIVQACISSECPPQTGPLENPVFFGYQWDQLTPGVRISSGMRYLYRRELIEALVSGSKHPPSPFGTNGLSDFFSWMSEDDPKSVPSLQRFVVALLVDRPDLADAFLKGRFFDETHFERWILDHGRVESPIVRYCQFEKQLSRNVPRTNSRNDVVDIVGSFGSEHGLGEAGRLLVAAIKTTPQKTRTISFTPIGIRDHHPFVADNESEGKITVIALNPEQMYEFWSQHPPSFRESRYVVGQWFWELEIAPSWYATAFRDGLVNELWAPTRFIGDMLRNSVPAGIEVVDIHLPFVEPSVNSEFDSKQLFDTSRFSFLFTFDFGSVMRRKNPEGTITAFVNAFQEQDGAQLVIKSINGHSNRLEFEKLRWQTRHRRDIIVIDEYFSSEDNSALMNSIDCYVSLHRSEGLGLTIAEAMMLRKPVIATSYSGNMDFMNENVGFLVPWEYTEVGPDAKAYPASARWAEPDLDAAADMMQFVFRNRDHAKFVGEQARQHLVDNFSPEVCGFAMFNRLQEIRGRTV